MNLIDQFVRQRLFALVRTRHLVVSFIAIALGGCLPDLSGMTGEWLQQVQIHTDQDRTGQFVWRIGIRGDSIDVETYTLFRSDILWDSCLEAYMHDLSADITDCGYESPSVSWMDADSSVAIATQADLESIVAEGRTPIHAIRLCVNSNVAELHLFDCVQSALEAHGWTRVDPDDYVWVLQD